MFFLIIISTLSVNASTVKFAQISDVHFSNNKNDNFLNYYFTPYLLDEVIKEINNDNMIKFSLVTGDICEDTFLEAKNAFMKLNNLNNKWYYVLGNHDIREGVKKDYFEFLNQIGQTYNNGKTYYSFKPEKDITFIGIDTVLKAHGLKGTVSEEQIKYIENIFKNLSSNDVVVIFSHHPLARVDGYSYITNQNALDSLFDKYNIPVVLLSGHLHSPKIFADKNKIVSVSSALYMYPSAYRVITIANLKDMTLIDFDFIEISINKNLSLLKSCYYLNTGIKEKNKRQTIIIKKRKTSHPILKQIYYYFRSKYLLYKYKINLNTFIMN